MWIGIEIGIWVYCALVGGLFAFQRRLMYFPAKMTTPPSAFGLKGVEDILLETSDKVRLQAWVDAARSGYPTLLYFHGNALHLGERAAWFKAFIDAGFGLVAVSHRGFGKSEGSATEAGLYTDARNAIEYAQGTLKRPSKKLIYFGESLGSGRGADGDRAPAGAFSAARFLHVGGDARRGALSLCDRRAPFWCATNTTRCRKSAASKRHFSCCIVRRT